MRLDRAEAGEHLVVAVFLDETHQLADVELVRIEVIDRLAVALRPMADQIGIEGAAPGHAARQEAALELRETASDAAQKQRLGERFMRRRQAPDMVIDIG